MRLVVGLCRYCTVGRENCMHYIDLRKQTIMIDAQGTLSHHCPAYYEVLEAGQRARVELREIEKHNVYHYDGESEVPYAEWVSAGHATGIIVDGNKKGFYLVKLDEPVELCYPTRGDWLNATEVRVTHTRRRLKDIEVISAARSAHQKKVGSND